MAVVVVWSFFPWYPLKILSPSSTLSISKASYFFSISSSNHYIFHQYYIFQQFLPLYFSSVSAHLRKGWYSGFDWSSSSLNFLGEFIVEGKTRTYESLNFSVKTGKHGYLTDRYWAWTNFENTWMTLLQSYVMSEFTFDKVKFFHWTPIDFEIEFASIHFGILHWISNMKQNSYSGKLSVCSNPSPRLTENLSFWQFLQFLAISALSADLALREADYRRKSLVPRPKKVACSTSKNLRKPYIYPLLRSKVIRKQPLEKGRRPCWHPSSPHFLLEIQPWSIGGEMIVQILFLQIWHIFFIDAVL